MKERASAARLRRIAGDAAYWATVLTFALLLVVCLAAFVLADLVRTGVELVANRVRNHLNGLNGWRQRRADA